MFACDLNRPTMKAGIISLVLLSLVLPGCGRHKRQESSSNPQSRTAATLPVSAVAPPLLAAADPQTQDTRPASRPSPFSDLREADRQQAASATSTSATPLVVSTAPAPSAASPQPTPSITSTPPQTREQVRKSAASNANAARKQLKPFVPKPADLSVAQNSRDRVVALPAAPPLAATALTPVPPPSLNQKLCCVGTAFLEPAKPAGFQRVLRRVPGLRRIGQHPEAEEGFVAAKPRRDITLLLPPGARASLRDGRMDLKASVDESGRVTRVELLSPKDEELVRLASYAASDWPFTPARLNDKTVPSEVILHFNFGN